MKKGLKIFLIILLVIFLFILFIGFITFLQIKNIMKKVENSKFEADVEKLMNGDCNVLPDIEKEYEEIKNTMNSACKNPIIKVMIERKEGRDICTEINSNKTKEMLSMAKKFCNVSSA